MPVVFHCLARLILLHSPRRSAPRSSPPPAELFCGRLGGRFVSITDRKETLGGQLPTVPTRSHEGGARCGRSLLDHKLDKWSIRAAPYARSTRTGPSAFTGVEPDLDYLLPASAFAIASLQPSLTSAACDFMQSVAPLPGLTSAQNCLMSALQAFLTTAARMIAT